MSKAIITEGLLDDIADAIIAKGGASAAMTPAEMASAIANIPSSGGGGDTPVLPSGYTRLDYIDSSGTQVIDLDVHGTFTTKVQVAFHYLNGTYNGWCAPIMSKDPTIAPGSRSGYTGSAWWGFGNKNDFWSDPIAQFTFQDEYSDDIKYAQINTLDNTTAQIDVVPINSVTKAVGATAIGTDDPNTKICLCGRKLTNGNFERLGSFRIFRAKVWADGTLIRDVVPCIQDSNDAIGVYDLVGNQFYGNSGTGVFIGGITE